MGNVAKENIAARYATATLLFTATNVPDDAGDAVAIEASSTQYAAPYKGWVAAIGVRHNADLTGGTITWNPTIGGTADTDLGAVTDDTNQYGIDTVTARTIPFSAGALLGVSWTKSGTVAPTTTDCTIQLIVVYDMEGH